MDEDLITKKELLELTGISYGALYRWKRMKILPDAWFIHRATTTGQETFFPREKVLTRVREIQQLKDKMSMEEIARHFSPGSYGTVSVTAAEAAEMRIAPPPVINQFLALHPTQEFAYPDLLELFIFSELLQAGSLSRDEAMEAAEAAADTGDFSEPVVYLLRKYGVAFCVTAGDMQPIAYDKKSTLAAAVAVAEKKAALNSLLSEKGITI